VSVEAQRGSSRALHFVWMSFALAAFYLLFAGQWGRSESIAGMVAVCSALGVRALAQRGPYRPFLVTDIPAVSLLWMPISMARDSLAVGTILVRTLWSTPKTSVGHWKEQPFVQGDGGGRNAFRRACVTLAISVTPNQFVAHLPLGKEALVVHCLADSGLKPKSRWPI
jgi:hypothetical protein